MTGVLLYLSDQLAAGHQPTIADIARDLGLVYTTARARVHRLAKEGKVKTTYNPRSLVITVTDIVLPPHSVIVKRRGNRKLPNDLGILVSLYEKPMSLKAISEIYNVDIEAVRQQLIKAGVTLRPPGPATRQARIKACATPGCQNQIGGRRRFCADCLKEHKRNQYIPHPRVRKLPETSTLIELYEKPMSLMAIGKMYGATSQAVRQQLKKAGYKLRPRHYRVTNPRPPKVRIYPKPIGCPKCETDHYSRGLCRNCYAIAFRRGELGNYPKHGKPGPKPWRPIGCPDCETEPFCRGLCRNCYKAAERRGELGKYPKVSERKRAARVAGKG